jgi:hypothetical protein
MRRDRPLEAFDKMIEHLLRFGSSAGRFTLDGGLAHISPGHHVFII